MKHTVTPQRTRPLRYKKLVTLHHKGRSMTNLIKHTVRLCMLKFHFKGARDSQAVKAKMFGMGA